MNYTPDHYEAWTRRVLASLFVLLGGCRVEHEGTFVAEYMVAHKDARTVRLGAPAVQIAVGLFHACALLDSGKVRCWGDLYRNPHVTGGNRHIGDNEHPSRARALFLDQAARSIAAAGRNSCALLEDGSVACWGHNFGEAPLKILGAGTAIAIAMGRNYACGLLPGAEGAECWQFLGQEIHRERITFKAAMGQIGVGNSSACALTAQGEEVVCWRRVRWQGDLSHSTIMMETPAQALAMGSDHVCVHSDERVQCWLDGDNFAQNPVNAIPDDGPVRALFANGLQSCVLLGSGSIRCWTVPRPPPTGAREGPGIARPMRQIRFDRPVVMTAWSDNFACVLLAGGSVRCWGRVMSALGDPYLFQRTLRRVRRKFIGKR